MAKSMGEVRIRTGIVLMTKQEKIQAAQKRIEELRKLISEWTKK